MKKHTVSEGSFSITHTPTSVEIKFFDVKLCSHGQTTMPLWLFRELTKMPTPTKAIMPARKAKLPTEVS